jgi:M6 family metalloprotease-like protein
VISAYWSATGAANSWALIGWQEFSNLNATLQVGLAVSSHVAGTLATVVFESVRLDDLPPWASVDVGAVGPAGTDVTQPGLLSIEGAGADIWGSVDAFRFHQTPWTGDGTITVRVRSIENTHQWAKAGVMFREALQADAKHVMVIVSPGRGIAMQYRAQTGGLSANAALVAGAAPEWLRLTRRKGTFTGYASEDGVTWRTLGSVKVPMYPDVHAGLAVTSHTVTTLATAVFEEWQVRPEDPLLPGAFALTAPAQGSTLRATTAAFAWQGSGDEFWLDVGSAPGLSDVYASGPLGQVSEHTVTGLPLDGMTLHVQVRRRLGSVVETATAEYTAPIRKGLLVIADFADRTLETWQGEGFTSVADVRRQLLDMRNHWEWLSRGREQFRWDIVRVTLPEPAGPAAYPSWPAYREAVITLARQQVKTADYDVNGDGIIDTAWIIVSNGDVPTGDYAIGGSSRNAGANTFVDGQASASVRGAATGNFNHEVGHNLGLPDMYGTYGTLDTLTVMSYSWPVPPPDMAAWERLTLGWLEPRVVTQTTPDVWLPSANGDMAAVMVPTEQDNEYFLIEYRTRPDSGYGSATPDFNGLAVYHVLEGSWNSRYPPLVKLEPADGTVEYSEAMDLDNLVYPGNPRMVLPMVLRTYAGEEVFRLENVEWRNGGLEFDLVLPAPGPNGGSVQ